MNVRPLHDRIIVSRIEEGEQKIGGIIIPDSAKEKPQQGKVIAAGNGKSKDDGKHLALLWLLLGGVGNDNPADLLFAFLEAADDDTVVKRSDVHKLCSLWAPPLAVRLCGF